MIKIVEILPGGEPVIKDIESLHSYGRKLFDEPFMDHANIGNDLYIAVGDSSAIMGKQVNFTISYGGAERTVCGPAVFVNRIFERGGGETYDEYKSLLAGEAAAIVDLFKRNRMTFHPDELHRLLGWEL
ncbi:MAG: hypothetical protein ACQEXV_25295 [Bacillota bacterium]